MKRKNICRKSGCAEPPFLGGLCEVHNAEAAKIEQRKRDALEALHSGVVDDVRLTNLTLRDELKRLSVWWRAACDSLNSSRPHVVLKDETEAAMSWCISLAQEIVDAERASRASLHFNPTILNDTSQWVWERFANLERGLMSNGVKRGS